MSGTQPFLVEQMLSNGYDVKPFASASLVHPPFGSMLFSDIPNLRMALVGGQAASNTREVHENASGYVSSGFRLLPLSESSSAFPPTVHGGDE